MLQNETNEHLTFQSILRRSAALHSSADHNGTDKSIERATAKARRHLLWQARRLQQPSSDALLDEIDKHAEQLTYARRKISQLRFEEALEEWRLLKSPLGRLRLRARSLVRSLLSALGLSQGGEEEMPRAYALDRVWEFAHRPIHFPTRPDWPPRLPTYKDLPDGGLSRVNTGERTSFASNRTAREIAAAALNIHKYGMPPSHLYNTTTRKIVTADDEVGDDDIVTICSRGTSVAFLSLDDRLWLSDANPVSERARYTLTQGTIADRTPHTPFSDSNTLAMHWQRPSPCAPFGFALPSCQDMPFAKVPLT